MSDSSRFGVNYVPRSGWWHSWVDRNEQSVREDLDAISQLGADHIRIHCLWPVFQPNPSLVSAQMLTNLRSLMDAASRSGLDVIVTVFNGWLSGFDFRPSWVDDGENIFTSRRVVDAQRRLLAEIADAVGGHPRFLGFDLANEPSSITTPVKNVMALAAGDAWVAELLTLCEELVPGGFHSVGMDHLPWLTDGIAFGRRNLANTGSVTPVHAWIFFTGALARYGETGTGTAHLAEYMLELTKAFSDDPHRPVWLQEYGLAPGWMSESVRTEFITRATLASASVENLWGITWWCSHDIDRALGGFVNLEYDLGLLDLDNQVKPAGEVFRDLVRQVRTTLPSGVGRDVALVLPDDRTPDLAFADAYFALIDQGTKPAIALESRLADRQHLADRGIRSTRRLEELLEPHGHESLDVHGGGGLFCERHEHPDLERPIPNDRRPRRSLGRRDDPD